MALPEDIISQVTDILLPYVSTIDDRDALLTEAFYIVERRLCGLVQLEGRPRVFAVRCVCDLLDFKCLPGRETHALAHLLATVRRQAGAQTQAQIDNLAPILNAPCTGGQPVPGLTPKPPTRPTPRPTLACRR